jgi:hypothetical protein
MQLKVIENNDLTPYIFLQWHYLGLNALLAAKDASGTRDVMRQLLVEIEHLPFVSEVRNNLEEYLGREAFRNRKLSDPLVFEMINSNEEIFQLWTINFLLPFENSWSKETRLRMALMDLLDNQGTSGYVKLNIFWLFQNAGEIDAIKDNAMHLIAITTDAALAYDIAFVLLVDNQYDRVKLADIFHSSDGALRQRAAILIVSHSIENDNLMQEVLPAVEAIAKNKDMPAQVRGDALEAIGVDAKDPARRKILLSMLAKNQWFFGAHGAHFKIHSLALVIQSLKSINDPQIHQILEELKPQMTTLRSGEREYVEWVLDNALGISRPYFSGPVDPDYIPQY